MSRLAPTKINSRRQLSMSTVSSHHSRDRLSPAMMSCVKPAEERKG
jgi:hypothetical protein